MIDPFLEVMRKDPRYKREAYLFASLAIEYTLTQMLKLDKDNYRHLTGQELARGMAELAKREYGPLARHVWDTWGIQSTRDWGNIIYNLIAAGRMNASPEDKVEDFDNVYDLETELDADKLSAASLVNAMVRPAVESPAAAS